MARRQILISFKWPPKDERIHQMQNFGEDLYRALEHDEWAEISIEEVDRATNLLKVRVYSPRHVHRITAMIEKQLRKKTLLGRLCHDLRCSGVLARIVGG